MRKRSQIPKRAYSAVIQIIAVKKVMEKKIKIREFLQRNLGIDAQKLSDDDALFTSGIIDSFAFLEMLSFLEKDLGCKIDLVELNIEQLDSIEALSKL